MDSKDIMRTIDYVNQRLEYEYNKWNETDDPYIVEECIWTIKSLEVRLNNLFILAKKDNIITNE